MTLLYELTGPNSYILNLTMYTILEILSILDHQGEKKVNGFAKSH